MNERESINLVFPDQEAVTDPEHSDLSDYCVHIRKGFFEGLRPFSTIARQCRRPSRGERYITNA